MNPVLRTAAAGDHENQDRGAVIDSPAGSARIAATCRALVIELVRYSSGALPDDVTVILANLGSAH